VRLIGAAPFPAKSAGFTAPLLKTTFFVQSSCLIGDFTDCEVHLLDSLPRPRFLDCPPQQGFAETPTPAAGRDVHTPNQGFVPFFYSCMSEDSDDSDE
jgi:hypothetical protein